MPLKRGIQLIKGFYVKRKLLLFQLLLAFTGQAFAADAPNPVLATLADNTVRDLGAFPCTRPKGDIYNCQQVTDYSGLVYDQNRRRFLMFGGGHATTFTDTVFEFNPNTLTWSELYAPTPCTSAYMNAANFDGANAAWISGPSGPYPRPLSRHTYDLLAVADSIPELILLGAGGASSHSCPPGSMSYEYSRLGHVAHFNVSTKTWSFSATAPGDGSDFAASEYDPVSRKIVLLDRHRMYVYDPITRIRTTVITDSSSIAGADLGYANHLVYYPPNQKMYYFNRNSRQVFELSIDRNDFSKSTIQMLSTTGMYPAHQEPGFAYDSVNRIIGGSVLNNTFYVFNPRTRTWTNEVVQGGIPGKQGFHALGYDPLNNVFLFVTDVQSPRGARTWAYRYRNAKQTTVQRSAAANVIITPIRRGSSR